VSQFSTQLCESFNRTKVKYCNKDVKWGHTFEPRMCCAVLDRNEDQWKLKLRAGLGLPRLPEPCERFLRITEEQRIARKSWVTSREYVEERRQERKVQKQAEARQPKKTGYKKNPFKK
jgi:hypothetical protein